MTGGQNSEQVEFCAASHASVGEAQDHLFFLPEEVRAAPEAGGSGTAGQPH